MDMEALEEFSGSNDHNLTVKGKRTKRQRPSSPVGTAVTSSMSSGSGGGGSGTGGGGGGGGGGGYFSVPSPISSDEISTNKEEDEDMANCLILLAQGFGPRQVEEEGKIEKLSSRKFTEIAGKAGFYVYECKTCNRTFPSFQALGGHRASHKKPKIVSEEKIRSFPITQLPFNEEEEGEEERQFVKISPPLSLQMASKNNPTTKSNKVHECSICGSEFSSGQALGGHMRRHRAPPNTRIGMNVVEMNINTNTTDQSRDESDGQRNILGLDLNLPAPPEDDHHRDSNFQFTAPNKHLVFSAPALVDCHY